MHPNSLPGQASLAQVKTIDDLLNHDDGEGQAWDNPWRKTYKIKTSPSKIHRIYKT